ncbi:hypothetical protein GF377_07950 [candidate division GN15 bacterium]|nr:hypothetical protein [candidate division GN15 bacterium]
MFGLSDISIELLTGTPLLVVLALVILLGLSLILYLKTNPPVPTWKRIVMGGLRILAVLVLIAALFEPVISYSREYVRNQRVAVLLDRSASMDRVENDKTRLARVDSLLSSREYDYLRDEAEVTPYYFGEALAEEADQVGREKTALGDALRALEKAQLANPSDHWLVFSDGNSNSGRRPVEAVRGLTVPVTTIGVALDIGEFDVGLVEVDANPVMFVGTPTEIAVKLTWQGGVGTNVPVQLRDGNRTITESSVQITEEGGFADVTLRYVPESPGQKLLQVSIPRLEGESSDGNNNRSIAVKVLKSRLNVLLVTGRPDYEVGFLSRFFRQSDKYELDLRALGRRSGNLAKPLPSSQAELNRFDVVVLHDPDPAELEGREEFFRSYLADRGGAIWLMMGDRFARRGTPDWLQALLPFYPDGSARVQYADFRGVPAEGQLFHPSVRLADDRATIRERWASLPPFGKLVPCDVVSEHATVLAFASLGLPSTDRLPILGYKRTGAGKLIASAAQPFWSWAFESLGFEGDNTGYTNLVEGTVNWLTVTDDFEPVRILPEKDVYTRGETVRFDGFAFDQGFRPIPDVVGSVTLEPQDGSESFEADLIQRGEGQYAAEFDQLPPGRYSYRGVFSKDGRQLKEAEGDILVETFSLEEFDQQGSPATLRAVSQASGGQFFSYDEFDQAVQSLDLSPVTGSVRSEFSLWGRLWLLLLFIGLLGLEWLLRKGSHLL